MKKTDKYKIKTDTLRSNGSSPGVREVSAEEEK